MWDELERLTERIVRRGTLGAPPVQAVVGLHRNLGRLLVEVCREMGISAQDSHRRWQGFTERFRAWLTRSPASELLDVGPRRAFATHGTAADN